MGAVQTLTVAMGAAWTSGINLYATILALGLAQNAGLVELPGDLGVLSSPYVLAVAGVMYVAEFFADKVPYIDNGWDAVHTFIRIPAGAILAAGALGDTSPALELAAYLGGGTVAAAAHGTKATVRLAVNASPEPFSNIAASLSEDLTVLGGLWLTFNYPLVMLALVIGFVAFAVWLIPKVFRLAKRGFQLLRARWGGVRHT